MDHSSEVLTKLILQLSVILFAAKFAGEICERFIKIPPVIGELISGLILGILFLNGKEILGPLFLGDKSIPGFGLLFGSIETDKGHQNAIGIPVSGTLWAIGQIGAIVLLFMAGLETNLRQFVKFAGPASLVAIGGVLLPFVLGLTSTVLFGFADSFTDPKALFIGAVMTATSVGITVRVLGDIKQLDTPEGVTIIGAAVLDDVLGMLILTIVVGLSATSVFSASSIAIVALKSLGFWVILTGLGIILSDRLSRFFHKFRVAGAMTALAIGLAFLVAGLAETFGLAMIIGAFSMGLALSGTKLAKNLEQTLEGLHAVLVPIFFVVIGMMVNITSMGNILLFGLFITILAAIGKILGSGGPSLFAGFNRHGAWRIGIGMMPRGEVALIMAGIGVTSGIIDQDLFGVTVMMTIITTVIAPIILTRAFKTSLSGSRSLSTNKQGDLP